MLYVKIVNKEVRVFGDNLALEASVSKGGGGGHSYDDEITEEQWKQFEYTARVVNGKIVYGKTAAEHQEEWSLAIRAERDRRLRICDKMSPMHWNALTDAQKQLWTDYRLNLLNIPQQNGFPWSGDIGKAPWPSQPEE